MDEEKDDEIAALLNKTPETRRKRRLLYKTDKKMIKISDQVVVQHKKIQEID